MSHMFHECKELVNILGDKTIWKITNVNNLSYMFYSCTSFRELT